MLACCTTHASEFFIKVCEVKETIEKLMLHKSDGSFMLSSDQFVNTGFDLSISNSFFTAIISHGLVPRGTSIVIPIHKKRYVRQGEFSWNIT